MVQYGSDFLKSPIGFLKILELILCIVLVALVEIFDAGVAGIVISLVILILSCSIGQECECVLKWQFLFLLVMAIWILFCCTILVITTYSRRILIPLIVGIVTGIVYIVDTIISYRAYKPTSVTLRE